MIVPRPGSDISARLFEPGLADSQYHSMNPKLFDLAGKVAIVTGTSRGLGQTFARALASAGADLVITSRDPSTLKQFQMEMEALGRKALPLVLDVRDYGSVQNMVRDAIEHYGKIQYSKHQQDACWCNLFYSR